MSTQEVILIISTIASTAFYILIDLIIIYIVSKLKINKIAKNLFLLHFLISIFVLLINGCLTMFIMFANISIMNSYGIEGVITIQQIQNYGGLILNILNTLVLVAGFYNLKD